VDIGILEGGRDIKFDPGYLIRGRLLDKVQAVLEKRIECAHRLFARDVYDLFLLYFVAHDRICHKMHDFVVGTESRHFPRITERIRRTLSTLDSAIGQFRNMLRPTDYLIIFSDHGFTPMGKRLVSLNRWLLDNGYLVKLPGAPFRDLARRFLYSRAGERTRDFARRLQAERILEKSLPGRILGRLKSAFQNIEFEQIDWGRTRAWSCMLYTHGGIWINEKGRYPKGIVEPGRAYESLRQELIEKLLSSRDDATGREVFEWVRRREEVFNGHEIEKMPDLVYRVAEGFTLGWDHTFRIRPLLAPWVRYTAEITTYTGAHHPSGIFALSGPGIKPGEYQAISGVDLAPTILYLLGLPIPRDMDGRVPERLFEESFLNKHPVTYREEEESLKEEIKPKGALEDEQARRAVQERLRALGYL